MSVADGAIVAVVGALLGLDTVSFPQAMLSRPLVACTLTAGLLGVAPAGLMVGAVVEAFALETLPVGASRYPEWGAASAVGGALAARAGGAGAPGAFVLAIVATLSMAWLGGWSMVKLRETNARLARARLPETSNGSRRAVIGLQVSGLCLDLVRGGAMTALGLLLFAPLLPIVEARWSFAPATTFAVLAGVSSIVAAGAVYKVFHATPQTRWFFVVGLGVGLAVLWVRV